MSCSRQVDTDYVYLRAEKGPAEILDYFIDYTKTFALVDPADSIATTSWALTGGGTLGTDDYSGNITRAFVEPHVDDKIGMVLRLTNTITTAGGRTHVRLIIIKIVNKLAAIPTVAAATPA